MSYHEGDYAGDYGEGDFLGIGHLIGSVGHIIGGLGIPVISGVANTVANVADKLTHPSTAIQGAGVGSLGGLSTARPVPGFGSTTSSTNVGYGLFQHSTTTMTAPGKGKSVGGYHQLASGKNAGKWVKNRRMNITNPKALRRAIRRGHGFEKMARRMLGFATPHKPKGRMYFRPKSRKR